MKKYQFGEAFNHMTYQCSNGHTETIWNSRDGVTPFVMDCRTCGADSQHIDWSRDVRAEAYEPKVGDRIFVSVTPQDAIEYSRKRIAAFQEAGYDWRETWPGFTLDEAVGFLANGEFYRDGNAPKAIIVTREWLDEQAAEKEHLAALMKQFVAPSSPDADGTHKGEV